MLARKKAEEEEQQARKLAEAHRALELKREQERERELERERLAAAERSVTAILLTKEPNSLSKMVLRLVLWSIYSRVCLFFRERVEKEKALALQRELERAAREKERRELEEKRKALEEKRKLVRN